MRGNGNGEYRVLRVKTWRVTIGQADLGNGTHVMGTLDLTFVDGSRVTRALQATTVTEMMKQLDLALELAGLLPPGIPPAR